MTSILFSAISYAFCLLCVLFSVLFIYVVCYFLCFLSTLCALFCAFCLRCVLFSVLLDYNFGGQRMGFVVLGISFVVSFYNAVFLISAPAETYYFGAIWILYCAPQILSCLFNFKFIVPTYRRCNCATAYEVRKKICCYFFKFIYSIVPTNLLAFAKKLKNVIIITFQNDFTIF